MRSPRLSDLLDDEPEWLKVGVAASLAQKYTADQRAFLHHLASMLQQVLPTETNVKTKGGIFSPKRIAEIKVHLGEWIYAIADTGQGNLRCFRTRVVRGIALKTEETSVEEWVNALGSLIEQRARESASARDALAKFIGLS